MSAKTNLLKPNSNWHRLLHLLDRNEGTLYKAQLYKPKKDRACDIIVDGMPLMTEYSLLASSAMRYEEQAARMGLVSIQRWNNRAWVILLPKGRSVLKALAEGKSWNKDLDVAVRPKLKYHKTITV